MRLKESIILDRLIDERKALLSREGLSQLNIDKHILAIAAMMDVRRKLDSIANMKNMDDVVVHVKFAGTDETGRKIKSRLRRELRKRHDI